MEEQKKRLNSSMTYEEYVNYIEKQPKKPSLKPKLSPDLALEDLELLSDALTTDASETFNRELKFNSLNLDQNYEQLDNKIRQRTYSENSSFTFLSFLEKKIDRKQSQ